MKMYIKSVLVSDQSKARTFYTDVLGFQIKHDIPMGEYNWLTVVSSEEPSGVELLLEPNAHEAACGFQKAMFEDGIPLTSFSVEDIQSEYQKLQSKGVCFTQPPTEAGGVLVAILDDTCGNLIQLIQLD